MGSATFEAPTVGIGRLIGEGSRFEVPHHQRDYSWTADEIEQLFDDIAEARTSDQKEYFIGLMVFMPSDGEGFTILDGQQRMATTVITFSAARNWLKARGFDQDAHDIQSDLIAVRELGTQDYHPRLMLNENNHPFFERFVINEAPDVEIEKELSALKRYDPNRRLLEAILFCRTTLGEMAEAATSGEDKGAHAIFGLVKFLREQVRVVRLTVESEANAYTVFETLNDRGLDLTVLDLVKNYAFGRTGRDDRLREVKTRWTQMTAHLTQVRADDFLKAWWTSRYGRAQKAQLFPRFKKEVSSWPEVQRASKDMLEASEEYAALELADDPLWQEYSREARERIRALKLLSARQVHPVMLSALKRFNAKEMERLLWLLEVLIVRYQLIGGGRTGRLEIGCASLAVKIWRKEVTSASAAASELSDLMPADNEFQEAFRHKQERTARKAVYILGRLEVQARRNEKDQISGGELQPSTTLTLEHVLPKNPGAAWEKEMEADESLLEECLHRYGNMCLLSKVNRTLGNKAFPKKREVFAKSDILLTKNIAVTEQWTRDTIDARQARLAKLARVVWRFQ